MAGEISVYQDTNIQVTNLRAILQGKTYAMANITSVSMYTQPGNSTPGMIVAVLGALLLLVGLADADMRGCALVFGLGMLVGGIAIAASARNIYWVRIGSASGETNALSSRDREYITRIVGAMNEAIILRG